jgi:uncharacterized protein (TIGR03492 family)
VVRSPTLLLLSNGHGEDVVGARLARALAELRPELELRALPTVGDGRAYAGGPARRVGPLRVLPAAGMTVRSAGALARDLRAGLLAATAAQARDLRASRSDLVVAVGDVWIEALGLLPRARRRYAVQTLVSARMDDGRLRLGLRAFRERFTPVERALLRAGYARCYARDEASAAALRSGGVPHARFLGNPMMDGLDAAPLESPGVGRREARRLLLLPGTRGHAQPALERMLAALERLPDVTAVVAWAGAGTPTPPPGWRAERDGEGGERWRRDGRSVRLLRGRFAEALAWAEAVVGTSGTAQEQAAGRGLPVVAFPCGAAYPPGFLAAQRRLLGEALIVSDPAPASVADAVRRLLDDEDERRRRGAAGRAAMGPPGGAAAIARDLLRDAVAAGSLPADRPRAAARVASDPGDAA